MDYKKIQAKYRDKLKPKFYEKGTEVEGVANKLGGHLVFVKKKPKMVNRSEAHRGNYPITDETGLRLTRKGAKHIVKLKQNRPKYDPKLTNQMRFVLRKEARDAKKADTAQANAK